MQTIYQKYRIVFLTIGFLLLILCGIVYVSSALVYSDGSVSNANANQVQTLSTTRNNNLKEDNLPQNNIQVREEQVNDIDTSQIVNVDSDGNVDLVYNMNNIPDNGGIVIQVLKQDNIGYFMPIWEGDAYQYQGEWQFNLRDIPVDNDGSVLLYRLWDKTNNGE